ncbi:hypothetical protein [Actinoplanes palleronii]|uniref:Uncharacterized protein n=1 Tax=Actinoplanes palleronii TaxID=113570 RepID=A0ABQ4B891_9ACTN|nr:hypothetical protein [Actinoplanes palleronii]GIE66475.1 hypothetical protein Apa02nite_025830 [Actinoplanes palleronii]
MSERDEEPIDRELEAMAGSAAMAREVKAALARMKNGEAGPEMAEMASDLLEGRIHLRDLAATSVYSGPMLEGIERYKQWESELTPEQREALTSEVRDKFGANPSDLRDTNRP